MTKLLDYTFNLIVLALPIFLLIGLVLIINFNDITGLFLSFITIIVWELAAIDYLVLKNKARAE